MHQEIDRSAELKEASTYESHCVREGLLQSSLREINDEIAEGLFVQVASLEG